MTQSHLGRKANVNECAGQRRHLCVSNTKTELNNSISFRIIAIKKITLM